MKLLLRAALRAKQSFVWMVMMLVTLLFLMVANQCEMLSLGILTDTGVDFFTLFNNKKGSFPKDQVNLEQVMKNWNSISNDKDIITKEDASYYLSHHDQRPLNRLMQMFRSKMKLRGDNLEALIVLLITVAIFKAISLFASRYTTQLFAIKVSKSLREEYFEHIQSLPMSFYQKYNIGSLTARVANDSTQIARSLNALITNYVLTPITVVTSLTACFYFSWQLSFVVFVGMPLVILPIVLISRKVKQISRQLQKNQETFSSLLVDFLAGIQTIKMFAMEAFSLKKYKEHNNRMAQLESKTAKYDLLVRPILHLITTLCLSGVLIFGLYILNLTIPELLVFVGFLHIFYEPVRKFAEENSHVQRGIVAAERLFEVLNIEPLIHDRPNAIHIRDFKHSIEFQNVWFRYEDQWILKDLSFTIHKGQTVAIVGATGSGKSTILNLIPRLYDVQKGRILIDGVDIMNITQKSLRDIMSFVAQKPFLFFDTVESNISYGSNLPKQDIVQAAKFAQAHDFISQLPNSYNTIVAESGKNLSGGQQQRISVARAIAKNAPLLILDEATSSLDSMSEERIKAAIDTLSEQTTKVIVAHRLTTIENADKIIVLDKGEKIDEGSREELLQRCETFAVMWKTHFNQGFSSHRKDNRKLSI